MHLCSDSKNRLKVKLTLLANNQIISNVVKFSASTELDSAILIDISELQWTTCNFDHGNKCKEKNSVTFSQRGKYGGTVRYTVPEMCMVLTVTLHRFRCNSALLQTPYHGKHGAHPDHRSSCEHCKHLTHYPAVCAEPEPAKAGEEVTAAW
ncbi:hypothetical protein UY3_17038 [Chelonia mydas]|uniref:Uncharacterized protein n=1 Tax=Chelonia mydas TaxID=8469 RepID=M7ASK8_CHEMY|nr:hypothetical protein UY3_17038 [Chelonia mydas]